MWTKLWMVFWDLRHCPFSGLWAGPVNFAWPIKAMNNWGANETECRANCSKKNKNTTFHFLVIFGVGGEWGCLEFAHYEISNHPSPLKSQQRLCQILWVLSSSSSSLLLVHWQQKYLWIIIRQARPLAAKSNPSRNKLLDAGKIIFCHGLLDSLNQKSL